MLLLQANLFRNRSSLGIIADLLATSVAVSSSLSEGNYLTSGLEYETSAMLGANIGIDDIYAVAAMSRLDGDYGLDDIEMGATQRQKKPLCQLSK